MQGFGCSGEGESGCHPCFLNPVTVCQRRVQGCGKIQGCAEGSGLCPCIYTQVDDGGTDCV
jgi:hypothetical protein